jgi:ribonuclease P protein subunit RPR2
MARKHRAKALAQERIDYLYELAQKWLKQERISECQTAIRHLKKLATSHVISISDIKQKTCKQCNLLLVPGATATVRIHKDRRIITCTQCQTIKRIGY